MENKNKVLIKVEKVGVSINDKFLVKGVSFEVKQNEIEQDNSSSIYDFEPGEEEILNDLLPRNLATQIFSSQIESTASELAARMTAMDNATRNAGDMIDNLTLQYNRTRQAVITKELIEIISGAEAL